MMKKLAYISKFFTFLWLITSGCQNVVNEANIIGQEIPDLLCKPESAKQLYESDKFQSALLAYDCLIQNDSTIGDYFFNRGICYMELYDFNKAIFDFKSSIKLDHRVADANYNISLSYISQADDSLALIFMKKYSLLVPNDPLARKFINEFEEIGEIRNSAR